MFIARAIVNNKSSQSAKVVRDTLSNRASHKMSTIERRQNNGKEGRSGAIEDPMLPVNPFEEVFAEILLLRVL